MYSTTHVTWLGLKRGTRCQDCSDKNTLRYDWMWLDNTYIQYHNWYDGPGNPEPSGSQCARLQNGTWWDNDCNRKYAFVCERQAGSHFVFVSL